MDVARKIWLAGVGAYGKMYEQAQGQFEKVSDAAQEVFEQLVEQGEKVEELVKTKLAQSPTAMNATAKASEFVHNATDQVKEYRETRLSNIESRLEHLRDTIVEKVQPFNIFALGQKIEELTATVAKLKSEVKALKAAAPKETAAPKAKKAA
jgi:poly(hydroxyalkanoate) granule-associated protein